MLTAERKRFYPLERQSHQPIAVDVPPPFEETHDLSQPVMMCKYCIRRQLGFCPKEEIEPEKRNQVAQFVREPLTLRLSNGTAFRLDFDCKNCLMKLYLQP